MPASTEDVLLKGFQMLEMENDRIETAQQVLQSVYNASTENKQLIRSARIIPLISFVSQFYAWFAKLQTNMDHDESAKYRC